jgi:hypothetical protein
MDPSLCFMDLLGHWRGSLTPITVGLINGQLVTGVITDTDAYPTITMLLSPQGTKATKTWFSATHIVSISVKE